ncbi:hypothetical protein HH308_21675 [Gordonia sp. TBRC 11910]|uniref:Uncharacterized protein n=1 Tax=Gordonia asplenii TaxID=2725283 RepID=A0A848KYQ8_9ACTN|nr:hypothetical protein [Gordonia asplenii]
MLKQLWLSICNIEDKRAREHDKERGKPANQRNPGRLIEGAVTPNWKRALEQRALVYRERIEPHL